MPLPSVVVMTVPRSPATLSRLLRVGSGRAKPARPRLRQRLGRPAPPTAATLRFGASRAARPSAGMEMCSDTGGGERYSVGEGQDGPQELQRGFLTFFPFSSLLSPFFFFYLSLFLTIFLLLSLFSLSSHLLSHPLPSPSLSSSLSLSTSLFLFVSSLPRSHVPVLGACRPV